MMQVAARQVAPKLFDFSPPARPRGRAQKEISRFNIFALTMVFLGATAFIYVYQQALVVQNNIDISRLQEQVREHERVGKNLEIDRMILSSPARLERLAKKSGMLKASKVNYIVIQTNGEGGGAEAQTARAPSPASSKLAKAGLTKDR